MENMTLRQITKACHGIYSGGESDRDNSVSGVVIDSRLVEKGYCFIATKGARVDGHSFIEEVIGKGASCVICEYIPEGVSGNFIVVEDSFQALKDVAEYYRSTLHIPVIGITGSVGKTSTKEFIAGVLSQKYRVLKTEGNFNNEVGVPLTLLRIRREHEIAVLEMGINHFGEMHRLSKIVKPDTCVLTNIGECHLEFLKSREGVLRAKSEIFDYLSKNGTVYVNGDDDMLQSVERVRHKRPVRFGMGCHNDYYAEVVENKGLLGSEIMIHNPGGSFRASVSLAGEHMIRNALAATAVGEQYGMREEEIAAGIAAVMPVDGRSHIVRCGTLTLIDDCYNANPVSMRAALDMLGSVGGRTVAILGDMGELGEDEIRFHSEIGAYAVDKKITGLVCVGRLARYMYQGGCRAKERNVNNTFVQYYETLEAMLDRLKVSGLLMGETTVLVKASHSMRFSKIVEELQKRG